MDQIEEKLKIESELAVAQRQLKNMLADLEVAKNSQIALESIKTRNTSLIEEQKTELANIMNLISDAKIAWNSQKANEEKELEEKKSEVTSVLARSAELDKKESEINENILKNQDILTKTHQIGLETAAQKVAIDVVKNEAESRNTEIEAKSAKIDEKIRIHKEKVSRVLNEINETE